MVVRFPIQMAGVRDDQAIFAAEFERERRRCGASFVTKSVLHQVSDQDGGPADTGSHLKPQKYLGTSVLVVPGIFGDCVDEQAVPFGDGWKRDRTASYTDGYGIYSDLGLGSIRALKIGGRSDEYTNAKLIADELLREADRADIETIVIFAYSKGVPDTLVALASLELEGRLPRKVKALVSFGGVVMGTPIADQMGGLYRRLGVVMDHIGCTSESQGDEVESLSRARRTPWLATAKLPTNVRYFSISASSSMERTAAALQPFKSQLDTVDPRNDGQVLVADSILPGSHFLAEVNSDHWSFVLPFDQELDPIHHRILVARTFSKETPFPREVLFRTTVHHVMATLAEAD